jgi:hypothetical protein
MQFTQTLPGRSYQVWAQDFRRTGATGGISGDGITASGDTGKFKP